MPPGRQHLLRCPRCLNSLRNCCAYAAQRSCPHVPITELQPSFPPLSTIAVINGSTFQMKAAHHSFLVAHFRRLALIAADGCGGTAATRAHCALHRRALARLLGPGLWPGHWVRMLVESDITQIFNPLP